MYIYAYSRSSVVRNSSKEPESVPSPRDVNELRNSVRNMVKVIDFCPGISDLCKKVGCSLDKALTLHELVSK